MMMAKKPPKPWKKSSLFIPPSMRELRDSEIVLLDRWHDGIYGVASQHTIEGIELVGSLEGMITDPVYEGKSITALIDLVKEGFFPEGSRVLYVHLGGQPAINAYTTAF